jgi:hypothetical protein
MCLLVYGDTGTRIGTGKEKGKETVNKADAGAAAESTKTNANEAKEKKKEAKEKEKEKETKEKGKEKGKGVDAKVEFDAPPSLLDLLSLQHRTLNALVRVSPLPNCER